MAQPAPSVPPEGTPINEWCASAAAALWAAYVTACAATKDFAGLRRYMPSTLRDDEWHRMGALKEVRATLGASLADRSERGEIELWARPGSRIEDSRLIPPTAVRRLEFDYEQQTGRGEGLPLLYDVRVRQAAATVASASVTWAIATTRRLQEERKIPEGVTKAKLARLLEAEAQKVGRKLMATYLENQLTNWGIWPLDRFK